MATARKKTATRKTAPRTAGKAPGFSLKTSAKKATNIYLGVLGASYDRVQENLDSVRKNNEKRAKEFEKRGARLRKELKGRFDKLEAPEFDKVVEDIKGQINKLQDQVEEAVENAKEKLTPTRKTA